MSSGTKNSFRIWEDGYYKFSSINSMIFIVSGETVRTENLVGANTVDDSSLGGTWKFGDFGNTHPQIARQTGSKINNVDINLWGGVWLTKGVVSEDGKRITVMMTAANEFGFFEKITEEDYTMFKNMKDKANAPLNHYKIQPEFQGRLLWVTGVPGSGNSTTGLFLSRMSGYVYYETDAFGSLSNPYIPPYLDEPSLATTKQTPLMEVPKDRIDAVAKGRKEYQKVIAGETYDLKTVEDYYTAMCKDIKNERKRMGGNWVVTGAVPTRALRNHIRKQIGLDLVFIFLDMTNEDQIKRIITRSGDDGDDGVGNIKKWVTTVNRIYEPAAIDEDGTISVKIDNTMSREDVVDKMLNLIDSDLQMFSLFMRLKDQR